MATANKVVRAVRTLLIELEAPFEVEDGSKHLLVRWGKRIVCVLPRGSRANHPRGWINAEKHIRRPVEEWRHAQEAEAGGLCPDCTVRAAQP